MSNAMSVKKDLKCVFNMPEKISSNFDGGEEVSHGLPSYAPADAFPVDEYEACPTNWMHGSDVASSYFIGVKEDHGMWLDFNECFYHTHDVAVVMSIQGVNPITGQKMVANKALCLEQYHKKCPVHNVDFKQDRHCEKCGFKWPGQNYIATTGTPEMMLWLDGFRAPDGKVRQYIFTEDKMRGVAAQLIGEERVFAIGIAYYISKNKKPYMLKRPEERKSSENSGWTQPMFFSPHYAPHSYSTSVSSSTSLRSSDDMDMLCRLDGGSGGMDEMCSLDSDDLDIMDAVKNIKAECSLPMETREKIGEPIASDSPFKVMRRNKKITSQPVTPVKKLEIGAGALVRQDVYDDPKMISYWEEKPAGMIYINYCDEETKKKILDGGRRADKKDGFMQGVKVGG